MTAISTTRAVERCERLEYGLGPPPAWWRVFALRRWLRAYRAIMALDISVGAQLLREVYPDTDVAVLAVRHDAERARLLRVVPRTER
jgi:hypothetical protein